MDCFCGCGAKLPSRLIDANLVAGRVALDLLAWDKVRSQGRLGADRVELESVIARGENCYGRLALLLHGEGRESSVKESEAWLTESFDHRVDRREMTTKGSILREPTLTLDETDYEALDRKQPGQSFSRTAEPAAVDGRSSPDVADQLERLSRLHAEGVLSDEEFAAASRRVESS
ncbi:MAG TPA: SHOCT domain-containing protein [Solirubrobacterales bacterium]|nr:SHOCT domain-containing protein [Solirubrobacterales bacterium]